MEVFTSFVQPVNRDAIEFVCVRYYTEEDPVRAEVFGADGEWHSHDPTTSFQVELPSVSGLEMHKLLGTRRVSWRTDVAELLTDLVVAQKEAIQWQTS